MEKGKDIISPFEELEKALVEFVKRVSCGEATDAEVQIMPAIAELLMETHPHGSVIRYTPLNDEA